MKAKFIFENIDKLRNINYSHGEDFFSSLLDVGVKKAVGYLPLGSIKELGGNKAYEQLIKWAKENNLQQKTIRNGETFQGALYFWDEKMLQNILDKYKDVLENAGIPITTEDYIDYIERNTVFSHKFPTAYRVIGLTFNDKRFR
jgi:hypothetical protein